MCGDGAFERIHAKDGREDAPASRKCRRRLNFFFSLDFTGVTKQQRLLALKFCLVANGLIVGFRVLFHVLVRGRF